MGQRGGGRGGGAFPPKECWAKEFWREQ